MNNRTLAGELEIDLIQVIRDLLLQWKAIVVVMLLFGILTPTVMYARDMKNYNAALQANMDIRDKVASNKESSGSADIYAGLTEEEALAVENALHQKKIMESKNEYLENSPLMNLDAQNIHVLVMKYYVDTPDGADLSAIGHSYIASFGEDDFIKKAAGVFNTTEYYSGELIFLGNFDRTQSEEISSGIATGFASGYATSDVLMVTSYLPEGVESADVKKLISDHMDSVSAKISGDIGPHTIKLTAEYEKTIVDRDLMNQQNDEQSSLFSLETSLNTTVTAFSDAQKQVYLAQTAELADEENSVSEAAASTESVDPVKPTFSTKYALLGLMIGVILYGGIYLLFMIFVPMIRTGLELSDMLGIRSFGCIHTEPKKFGFLCDRFVYKHLYHKEKSADELMSDVAERISVFAKYYEVNEITLVSSDAVSSESINKLSQKLASKGVTASVLNLWDGDKITDLIEENLSNRDNYIICLMPKATRISDVDRILSLASEFEKKVIGTVAI